MYVALHIIKMLIWGEVGCLWLRYWGGELAMWPLEATKTQAQSFPDI